MLRGVRSGPRPARTADLPDIVALLEGAGLPLQGLGTAALWVAGVEQDAEAVGVIGLETHGDVGLLRSLAVREEHRGAGIGRALVERVVSEARQRGLRSLYLLTTDAAAYFGAQGFQPTTRATVPEELRASAEFQGVCPDTAQVLVRALDP